MISTHSIPRFVPGFIIVLFDGLFEKDTLTKSESSDDLGC